MRWATPAQWYRSGMLKCWRYNGLIKGGAMLVVVLKGLLGLLKVAAWLLLTFCDGVDSGIWWPMAGFALFGGTIGRKLLKTAALSVTWFRFGDYSEENAKSLDQGYSKGDVSLYNQGARWARGEETVFCCELLETRKFFAVLAGIVDGTSGSWWLTNWWGGIKGCVFMSGFGSWGTLCIDG